jgi:hypothetical protein
MKRAGSLYQVDELDARSLPSYQPPPEDFRDRSNRRCKIGGECGGFESQGKSGDHRRVDFRWDHGFVTPMSMLAHWSVRWMPCVRLADELIEAADLLAFQDYWDQCDRCPIHWMRVAVIAENRRAGVCPHGNVLAVVLYSDWRSVRKNKRRQSKS